MIWYRERERERERERSQEEYIILEEYRHT